MQTTKRAALLLAWGSVLATGASLATPAVAQDIAAAGNDSGDIIVTARKREENLQEVPLSISAFTAETIERQGLRSIQDIANLTPGFSYRQGFGRNADRPVIRGMSNIQGAPNAAFFIDGIFVTGSLSSYNLDNLERVEVIKGPQSALFGRATFSGAINFITRQPDNTPRGRVALTLGEDGLKELSGFVSGPLVQDRLFAQVDARVAEFGGQYANFTDPREKLGRERSKSVGLTLRGTPTDNFTMTGRIAYLVDKDGAYPVALIGRKIGETLPVPGVLINNNARNCLQPVLVGVGPSPAQRPVASGRTRGYFCGEIPNPSAYSLNSEVFRAAGYPDSLDRNILRTSLKAELDVNDWSFVAIGAYNRRRQTVATDQDYSDRRQLGFETIDYGGSTDYSGEFKIISPAANRVRGILGVYYYQEKSLPEAYSASLTFPGPPTRVFQIGDDRSKIIRNAVFANSVENKAIFGQIQFDITDTLTLSAEGRYQVEDLATVGTSSATVAGVAYTRSIKDPLGVAQYKKFLPRFTLDWNATDDLLLYGVIAQGNKPGGLNSGVYNAIYDDSEVARLVGLGLDSFDEETSWNYEVGVKSQWMDRRLTANLALYQIDWDNQQLTQTIQAARRDGILASVSFTSNVGQSRVRGLEFESNMRVTDWFDLRVGYALQDAKIRDFVADDQADLYITAADITALNATAPLPPFQAPGSPGYAAYLVALAAAAPARFAAVNALLELRGNAAGNYLPRVPKHQLVIGGTFNFDVTPDIAGTFNANLAYESKRYIQVDNLGWSGDSFNLGLRAGLTYEGFSLTAFMTNTLNDRTPVDVLRSIDTGQTFLRPALRPGEATAIVGGVNVSSANIRDFVVTAPRLRNFGMTLAYKF